MPLQAGLCIECQLFSSRANGVSQLAHISMPLQ
jgi:hypothetical protein